MIRIQGYLEDNMFIFVVSIVPADGLTPPGARISAYAVTAWGPEYS